MVFVVEVLAILGTITFLRLWLVLRQVKQRLDLSISLHLLTLLTFGQEVEKFNKHTAPSAFLLPICVQWTSCKMRSMKSLIKPRILVTLRIDLTCFSCLHFCFHYLHCCSDYTSCFVSRAILSLRSSGNLDIIIGIKNLPYLSKVTPIDFNPLIWTLILSHISLKELGLSLATGSLVNSLIWAATICCWLPKRFYSSSTVLS